MITLCIGNDCRDIRNADANWITSEVQMRRRDGQCVCVRVTFAGDGLDFSLASPECGSGGVGGRPPTAGEARILELWRRHHLDEADITPGNVVAFVRQL